MNAEKNETVKYIFDNVNYWLAFAEAKNAGLLAANMAALAVLLQIEERSISIYIIICLVLISTFIVFLSLWSKMFIQGRIGENCNENDNMLFYKDIAKYSAEEYCKKVYYNYFNENLEDTNTIPRNIKDMIFEININSKIATRKFILFNLAIRCNLVSLVYLFLVFIIA